MCPVYQNSFITIQEEHSRLPHKVIWENAKSVQSCYQKEVKKCYFEIAKDSFLLHYFNFHLSFQNFADLKCEKSRIVQMFDCYCKENYMMMRKKNFK